jgi:DNA-binding NarL/FixJ family response regulator
MTHTELPQVHPDVTPPNHETTVVLADDHAIVREGFAALCRSNGMKVLAQASDGRSAIDLILDLRPEFAILDMDMPPGPNGTQIVRQVRAAGSNTKLLILSITSDQNKVVEAVKAGVDGYLLKDGPARHLQDAISYVREGGVYLSPLLRGAAMFTGPERPVEDDPMAALSPRETEVFTYLVNGYRAKDIAKTLDISPKTVDTYRASLMRKLKVRDLVSLVKFAIEHNLTETSGPPPEK